MDKKYSSVNGDPNEHKPSDLDQSTIIENQNTAKSNDKPTSDDLSIDNIPVNLVTVMGHSERSITVFGNDLRNKNPTKMGNLFTFLFFREEPWICVGPHYPYALGLFILINILNILLIFLIYPKLSSIYHILGIIFYIIQIMSFLFLFLVNPGIPSRKFYISEGVLHSIYTFLEYTNSETFDKYKICKICNIYVPPDSVVIHCEDCNICVTGKIPINK